MKLPNYLFGICAAIAIVWTYMLVAALDDHKSAYNDPELLRQASLRAATDVLVDAETRAAAAQAYCGNAGWKISNDNKTLTCIPRRGKPYIAKPAP